MIFNRRKILPRSGIHEALLSAFTRKFIVHYSVRDRQSSTQRPVSMYTGGYRTGNRVTPYPQFFAGNTEEADDRYQIISQPQD